MQGSINVQITGNLQFLPRAVRPDADVAAVRVVDVVAGDGPLAGPAGDGLPANGATAVGREDLAVCPVGVGQGVVLDRYRPLEIRVGMIGAVADSDRVRFGGLAGVSDVDVVASIGQALACRAAERDVLSPRAE